MALKPEEALRTVKPRLATFRHLPIIACDFREHKLYLERTETVMDLDELPAVIAIEPSSLLVGRNIGRAIKMLDDIYSDNERWQIRAVPLSREIPEDLPSRIEMGDDGRPVLREQDERKVIVWTESVWSFVGFRRMNGHNKSLYHYPLDPVIFCRADIGFTFPDVVAWARDVRDWCQKQNIAIRPTSGGLAGQLLKDKRFYPDARRKVPKATNAKARPALPGNYYELFVNPSNRLFEAAYIDQKSAHHECARTIQFPSANDLHAKGNYDTLEDEPYAVPGDTNYESVLSEFGLFYVKLQSPIWQRHNFPPPQMMQEEYSTAFIHSNELAEVRSLGAKILYVIAAWSSPTSETGINKYAEWALKEIAESSQERKRWLKSTLLASYGLLAAKPRAFQYAYKRAKEGEPTWFPCGSAAVQLLMRQTEREFETPIANVIHRGMIEAETRLRSLRLARELNHAGYDVLSIYADSLFIGKAKQLPLLPAEWSVKANCSNLQFLNATQFISQELTKLPGITGKERRVLLKGRPI